MKTLHLTLKKGWFDMILSGEKTEEYREIKSHWITRLVDSEIFNKKTTYEDFMNWVKNPPGYELTLQHIVNNFDAITFKNGYSKNAPTITIEFKGIDIGVGLYIMGAPNYPVFIIKLGKILETKNV